MASLRMQAQARSQRLSGRGASSSLDFQWTQPADAFDSSGLVDFEIDTFPTDSNQMLSGVGGSSRYATANPSSSKQLANRNSQNGPLSPFSSLSDIAHLINQSSAVTLGRLSPAQVASNKSGLFVCLFVSNFIIKLIFVNHRTISFSCI